MANPSSNSSDSNLEPPSWSTPPSHHANAAPRTSSSRWTPQFITAVALVILAIALIVGSWIGVKYGSKGAWACTGVTLPLALSSMWLLGCCKNRCSKKSDPEYHSV